MDSIEVTKISTAVLVAGIAYFMTGLIGANLVHPERPAKPVIAIKGAETEAAAGPTAPAPLAPIGPLLATADPAAGEATFKKLCTSCHTADQGGKAGIGPNLYGVVGGPHGHMQGFNYTAGLKAKTGPWTYDELNQWLKKPSAYVPGTRMTFAGLNNDKERANVIDYLRTLSPNPLPLPPATSAAEPQAAAAPAAGPASAPVAAPGTVAPHAPAASGTAPTAHAPAATATAPPAPAPAATAPPAPAPAGTAPPAQAPATSGTAPAAPAPAAK